MSVPSEEEAALLALSAVLFEVIVARGIAPVSTLDKLLADQRKNLVQRGMPHAASLIERMRRHVTSPERAQKREIIRRLRDSPPEGSA